MNNNFFFHIITIIASVLVATLVALATSTEETQLYDIPIIYLCAGLSFVVHWTIAIPALITKSEKYFDLTGMIATLLTITTAMVALLNSGVQISIKSIIVASFVSIWTLRLGLFLFSRIIKSGEDKRFREIKGTFSRFFMTWTLSALWVFLTIINALTIIIINPENIIDSYLIIGTTLWILGFLIETVADKQKRSFNSRPENKGSFITTGLWSKSRHPNYFGEILLWFGISIISLPLLSEWQYVSLISPIFVYLLITKISGIPMLESSSEEKWGNEKTYQDYKTNTPILVPYFGKK